MAPRVTVSESELLAALADAAIGRAPEDALTVAEIVEATGASVKRIREALRAFARQGRLGVHTVRRTYLDGRDGTVPAYTIAPTKKRRR